MSDKTGRPSQREAILDAAELLVAEQGAGRLTFDNLVRQTGTSKGGLLYHFANKEELLQGMVERMVGRHEVRRQGYLEQLNGCADAQLRSILLAVLCNKDEPQSVSSAVLAAAALNPCLLAPVTEQMQAIFAMVDKANIGKERARVLLHAVHGARLFEQLGLCHYENCDRDTFGRVLQQIIDEWQPK